MENAENGLEEVQLSRKLLVISLVIILVGVLATPLLVLGQSEETVLTIAVLDWMNNTIFTPDLFGDFEAEHPGVKVVIVASGDATYVPPAEFALDRHLDIPSLDSCESREEQSAYYAQYTECAVNIDPSLASRFGPSQ